MYIRTQGGVQPIHNAAASGHIGLISILVKKYGVDPQAKAKVCIMHVASIQYTIDSQLANGYVHGD